MRPRATGHTPPETPQRPRRGQTSCRLVRAPRGLQRARRGRHKSSINHRRHRFSSPSIKPAFYKAGAFTTPLSGRIKKINSKHGPTKRNRRPSPTSSATPVSYTASSRRGVPSSFSVQLPRVRGPVGDARGRRHGLRLGQDAGPCCAIALQGGDDLPELLWDRREAADIHDADRELAGTSSRTSGPRRPLRCAGRVYDGRRRRAPGPLRRKWRLDDAGRDQVKALLRIGLQTDCQVTSQNWGRDQLRDADHVVTQIFASACSVAYSQNGRPLEGLRFVGARASYEAALIAAALNAARPPGPRPLLQSIPDGRRRASSATASRGSRAPSRRRWLPWIFR